MKKDEFEVGDLVISPFQGVGIGLVVRARHPRIKRLYPTAEQERVIIYWFKSGLKQRIPVWDISKLEAK